jgi:hypothetical protein
MPETVCAIDFADKQIRMMRNIRNIKNQFYKS